MFLVIMRALFNTTCDIIAGPGSSTPGLVRASPPCRFVRDDAFFSYGDGAPVFAGYVTLDALAPIGAWKTPAFGMDPRVSDQIAIPSGSSPRYWTIFTEHAIWHARTPYFRSYVAALPLPPTTPPSAIVLAEFSVFRGGLGVGQQLAGGGGLGVGQQLAGGGGLGVGQVLAAGGMLAFCDPSPRNGTIGLVGSLAARGDLAFAQVIPGRGGLAYLGAVVPTSSASFILSAVLPASQALRLDSWQPAAGSIVFA